MLSSFLLKKRLAFFEFYQKKRIKFFSWTFLTSSLMSSLLLAEVTSLPVAQNQPVNKPSSSAAQPVKRVKAQELLGLSDIKPIIDQMLEIHIRYNMITPELFQKIIEQYFRQFDANQMYLLQAEIDVYSKVSELSLKAQIERFQKADYSLFQELDRVIQKSIWRARQWRVGLKAAAAPATVSALKNSSPIKDLMDKWKVFFSSKDYENQLDFLGDVEREYLYVDEKDNPLKGLEKDHSKTLHILKAVASSLDAHSDFFSPQEVRSFMQALDPEYVGVGVILTREGQSWFVKSVVANSPAAKSQQIQPGDQLVQIDNNVLVGHDKDLNFLRKKAGDKLKLVFDRKGLRREVELEVANLESTQERIRLEERIMPGGKRMGYLAMDSFYEGENPSISSATDILRAIDGFKKEKTLDGLILDLRQNLGGYLDQAVKVVGLFITNGVVVISKYSDGSAVYYRDMDPNQAFTGPVVVLTSRMSASASEIVAQSLQDYGVAVVVGDRSTYGKGTIQAQTLSDKDAQAYYKLTVGRYYTASGRSTQLDGVPIDVVVPGPYDRVNIGERYQLDPLTPDSVLPAFSDGLSDIKEGDRPWMMKHYLPTLQHRSSRWKAVIPKLKENSQKRQDLFFKNKPLESCTDQELWDMQTNEAYEILNEMTLVK
jgi:carboxyl-terminal processing protease